MVQLPPTDPGEARALIRCVREAAAQRGLELAEPPEAPEPEWCCGRGCERCVWLVYYEALEAWRQDAMARIESKEEER